MPNQIRFHKSWHKTKLSQDSMLKTILHRPIAVTMTLIAIVTLGVLALGRIPVSLMPDIDVPRIVVQVSAQGSAAREIDQRIVGPLRQQLAQVTGLKDIESISQTNAGTITLTFSPGNDMSLAFIEVNEKIDRAMGAMPKDMERPKVMKTGALDIPAFYVDITGGKPEQTSRLVRNIISKRMEQLPEVAMVDCSGMVGTQITIIPDEGRMLSLGITNNDIERAISNNNIVLETLSIRNGIYRYSIHFDSQILSTQDIENIYLRHEGRLLQIKDICHVEESTATRKGFITSNGKDAITMAVIKQSDAQMSDLQQSLDTLMSQLRMDYPELTLKITRDQTLLLSYSMRNLEWNLMLGILMAAVVLYVFIGGWRLPTLVAIAIPLSLILTLLCFYLIGISLNIISLSGLILGVGMIVDNAIIVIDNIQQRGQHDETHIVSAVKEVFMPMLSSVLTTCSVFVPLIFLSGTAGALFFDQAMGISIALFCSLAVAAIVVPVYYYQFCRNEHVSQRDVNRRLASWYERGMRLTLRNAKGIIAWSAVCLLAAVALLPLIRKERMPRLPHDDALVTIDWNAGITAEENNRRMQGMLNDARQHIETYTAIAGGQDFILSHTKNMTAGEAVCYVKCRSAEELDSAVSAMKGYVTRHYPKAKTEVSLAANIFDMIFLTDEPALRLRLQADDGGRPAVEQVRYAADSLRKVFPALDIQPVGTEPCLQYSADAGQMAYYKITFQQLYSRMKELLGSYSVYNMNNGGESVPVIVGADSRDTGGLLASTIRNSDGTDIPLSYLVSESITEDFKQLHAGEDGDYAVIDIEHATDREAHDVIKYASKLPLHISFGGGYFSSRIMIGELSVVMLVAVLLLYFILAAQFESMLQPAIILIEVVIDTCLVVLALYASGESLNVMSMIGMVVMCGIIINDSILKVDTINRLRRSGMPLLRSIITAGHIRLKPIVMTSLTTILALVPFLHKGDMGSALQFPLSFTIVTGMVVGTLVSLFFVPLTYYLIYKKLS